MYDRSITKQSQEGAPGDLAVLYDQKKKFLAVGLYDPFSPIRVRLLQHRKPAEINREWFIEKVHTAKNVRKSIDKTKTNGYRLIHGENDGLPGLVADLYADTLTLKLYTAAWVPHLEDVLFALAETVDVENVIVRMSRHCGERPEFLYGLENGQQIMGQPIDGEIIFKENGLSFEVDPVNGQKTGFFLDQRDNRARVEKLSFRKNVLNVFSYSGGFSLYAARGGARSVTSVDISRQAIAGAKRNFSLNFDNPRIAACAQKYIISDAFKALGQLAVENKSYDMVIIDPPSFAKNQKEAQSAMQSYAKLVTLGLGVLRAGGILVFSSCSAHIVAEDFFKTIFASAENAERRLEELDRTQHAPDHPTTFPEGAYLKCLFAKG